MLARRLLLLAAVLMLLTVLAAGLAPEERAGVQPGTSQPAGALPAGATVSKRIPAAPGANTRVDVTRGDTLELEIEGELLDSVLIERLNRIDGIEPRTPARFNLLIETPAGSYPIRLVEADRRIGSIVVAE